MGNKSSLLTTLLAEYLVLERDWVPVILAVRPERTATTVAVLEARGAAVIGRRDPIGYLYAQVSVDVVESLSALDGLLALQLAAAPGGTSASGPHGAGHIALLVSAARQTGIAHDAVRLRAAIATTAKFLEGVETRAQGHGLIQVSDAWEALQRARNWEPPSFIVAAPIVAAEAKTGGVDRFVGRGLFELSGWHPGKRGQREVKVTRTGGCGACRPLSPALEGRCGSFHQRAAGYRTASGQDGRGARGNRGGRVRFIQRHPGHRRPRRRSRRRQRLADGDGGRFPACRRRRAALRACVAAAGQQPLLCRRPPRSVGSDGEVDQGWRQVILACAGSHRAPIAAQHLRLGDIQVRSRHSRGAGATPNLREPCAWRMAILDAERGAAVDGGSGGRRGLEPADAA